ncbi:hypothetical protein CTKZ_26790 [Cellulomonas algicola]|uniref:Uncharacterized protein n=1 Tax=Cellulomonas algicola TaxID=2071633 RepID=A0A401V2G3_9CELL|nr:hypothetical protein CTKZ_26790 [Cellulomonas algicola]
MPASDSGVAAVLTAATGSVALMVTSRIVGPPPTPRDRTDRPRARPGDGRDIGNILVAEIHPCKQG